MVQQPFTPDGVTQKLHELYALSDPNLQIEANLVLSDFGQWMSANFILDAAQSTYLNDMGARSIDNLSQTIAFCFVNRLPIVLIQGEQTDEEQTKFVITENAITTKSGDDGGFHATGTFIVKIVYE